MNETSTKGMTTLHSHASNDSNGTYMSGMTPDAAVYITFRASIEVANAVIYSILNAEESGYSLASHCSNKLGRTIRPPNTR